MEQPYPTIEVDAGELDVRPETVAIKLTRELRRFKGHPHILIRILGEGEARGVTSGDRLPEDL